MRPVLLAGPTDRWPSVPEGVAREGAQLTEQVGKPAVTLDVPFVNAFVDDKVRAAEYWSEDRLHLNPHGHRRVANPCSTLSASNIPTTTRCHPSPTESDPMCVSREHISRHGSAVASPGDRRPTGAPANTPPGPNWYPTRAEDMTEFSVASFNVNGIRAARRRGFDTWLADRAPDVVGIQELRCPETEVGEFAGYEAAVDVGSVAGRNGVGTTDPHFPGADLGHASTEGARAQGVCRAGSLHRGRPRRSGRHRRLPVSAQGRGYRRNDRSQAGCAINPTAV